jgi:UDP-glucose 4-epimerase
LGTGRGHSVREVIAMVEKVTGKSVPTLEAPRRAGDPPVLVADSTRAAKVLGWRPRYSDLHTIVDSAWNWHANGQHGSRKEVRRNKVSMN